MADPVTIAKLWLAIRPIKRIREWRKAKRDAREGRESVMQIDLGTRTSTNAVVGGGVLSQIYVAAIGLIPYPPLVAALTTPEAVALVAVLIAGVIARFSKTPAQPGKL